MTRRNGDYFRFDVDTASRRLGGTVQKWHALGNRCNFGNRTAVPPAAVDRFTVDCFGGTRQPVTSEVAELAADHQLPGRNPETGIRQEMRRTFIDAALRTFRNGSNRAVEEFDFRWPASEVPKVVDIIDDLAAAW